jgi:hypothetical protein
MRSSQRRRSLPKSSSRGMPLNSPAPRDRKGPRVRWARGSAFAPARPMLNYNKKGRVPSRIFSETWRLSGGLGERPLRVPVPPGGT